MPRCDSPQCQAPTPCTPFRPGRAGFDPSSRAPTARRRRSWSLSGKVGDYTRQLRALEKTIKENPDDPGTRFLLAFHYGYLGYPSQAVKQLDKVIKLQPVDKLAKDLRDQFSARIPKPADNK